MRDIGIPGTSVPTSNASLAALAAAGGAILLLALAAVDLLALGTVGAIAVALTGAAAAATLAIANLRAATALHGHVTERAAVEHRLARDPLTGLLNRPAFRQLCETLDHGDPDPAHGDTLVVAVVDLDRFRTINDMMGDRVGDQLLVAAAERLAGAVGDAVAIARLGGDMFAAIVSAGDGRLPQQLGDAIVAALGQPLLIDGRAVELSASVGIAVGAIAEAPIDNLLRHAELATCEAKGGARGACRVYDDALIGRQKAEGMIRVELGRALAETSFDLHYQPLIDARSGAFSSAEALLRSRSAGLGKVPVHALIAVAESSGQIVELTDWTLATALDAVKRLDAPVAVNVSPVYFRNPDFVHRIMDRLIAAHVRPDRLTVEVTEGVLIADITSARESIARLREIGVNVFLDDFGTGYSSLSYLKHFELDGLKLDKSFLRDVGDRRKVTQILRSLIDFGHSLDMRVVVEGVESDWQARLLQLLGCDLLQGYELGVPMPLDELIAFKARLDREPLIASASPSIGAVG